MKRLTTTFSQLLVASVFLVLLLLEAASGSAQPRQGIPESTTPKLHIDFPFQTMWDDALKLAAASGKPVLVFNLDLIDSNSTSLAEEVLRDKNLQQFIRTSFEPSMNDFAVDPPVSVGLDSLRNLGQRLSGLEKRYQVVVRPTVIVLASDGTEIDRIPYAQRLTSTGLRTRLTEILEGRNTIQTALRTFYRDTTSVVLRQQLIDLFEERSNYDSVIRFLEPIMHAREYPTIARQATVRHAYLRLQVEGKTEPLYTYMSTLSHHGPDSAIYYNGLEMLLAYFQKRKMVDSISATYDRMIAFTGVREADLLNDYAWHLTMFSRNKPKALELVNEAIAKNPNDADFYDTRATIYGALKRYDDAIFDEEKGLSIASENDKKYFADQIDYFKNLKAHPPKDETGSEHEESANPSENALQPGTSPSQRTSVTKNPKH